MKRLLLIAVAGFALTFVVPSNASKAADGHFGGGHHYHGGGHHGGFASGHSGHGYYGGHGYAGHRAITPYYGSVYRSYAPGYGGGYYAPNYRAYRPAYSGYGHGGVHLDVGRFHLGVGAHH